MINVQIVRLFCVGLFIVDGYYDVYVWEGWMPEDDDDVRTGSGRQRWDKDRRLAMETALNYAKGLFLSNLCIICFAKMFFIWRWLPFTWKNPSDDFLGKWYTKLRTDKILSGNRIPPYTNQSRLTKNGHLMEWNAIFHVEHTTQESRTSDVTLVPNFFLWNDPKSLVSSTFQPEYQTTLWMLDPAPSPPPSPLCCQTKTKVILANHRASKQSLNQSHREANPWTRRRAKGGKREPAGSQDQFFIFHSVWCL